jgi:hypothetical protein
MEGARISDGRFSMSNSEQIGTVELSTLPDGRISLAIDTGSGRTAIALSRDQVTELTATLLSKCTISHKISASPRPDFVSQRSQWSETTPTSVGLAPSVQKDHHCLMLIFGDAHFGVSLEMSSIRKLGEMMTALGATGQAQ